MASEFRRNLWEHVRSFELLSRGHASVATSRLSSRSHQYQGEYGFKYGFQYESRCTYNGIVMFLERRFDKSGERRKIFEISKRRIEH